MEYVNYYKQMRLLLIYDLPMIDDEDRKIYQRFHNKLISIGFNMLQYSIYSKVVQNDQAYKQLISKINKILPQKGNIAIIKITEKQYEDMIYLRGEQNRFDAIIGGKELIIFGGDTWLIWSYQGDWKKM